MSPVPVSKNTVVALAIVLLSAAVIYVWLGSAEEDAPLVDSADAWPVGRWHARVLFEPEDVRDELARTLSLPYTGTGGEATADTGVQIFNRELSAGGVTLYTSGHAPEVILIDMDGGVLHRWRMPFETAFPEKPPTSETTFFRRATLLDGGDLLAIYQGGGMVRLDRDSRLVWTCDADLYNDFHLARDGRIYAIAKTARIVPSLNAEEPVLEDAIVVIDSGGRPIERFSLLEAFLGSRFADLLAPMRERGDIFHTNTVDLLEGERGSLVPGFPEGSILVSMREVDIVAVVDPRSSEVLWAQRGPWRAQHQPELLDDGRILIFDNRGSAGRARVLELDSSSGEVVWEYPAPGEPPLWSPQAGSAQRLSNGNTLITESESGRAIEIAPDGEIVWEFVSPHRGGEQQQLVATLFEALRLPAEAASFLE